MNSYAPNTRALKFIKGISLQAKPHICPHTAVVVASVPYLPADTGHRHIILRKPENAGDDVTSPMDLADAYRTFQLNTTEYTYFSATHRTCFKIGHVLGYKAVLDRYKRIEITFYRSLSNPHGLKQIINSSRKYTKGGN